MHDVSFFLLKSLLPVGVLAILFFGIGLILAKFIWGRFQQRLNNAIEENMNLASQWSALGSSQQDLFKKLRVRWQSDRDAFDNVLGEKDQLIARLTEQLKVGGADVSALTMVSAEDVAARAKVRELESALAAEKSEVARLREEAGRAAEMPILPFAMLDATPAKVAEDEDAASRIRDLEQDLIDTHDELHRVRADYEKQVKLVESLESKLIAVPAPVAAVVSPEIAQMTALLAQRARESKAQRDRLHGLRNDAAQANDAVIAGISARQAETIEAAEQKLAELETLFSKEKVALESLLAEAGAAAEVRQAEVARLEEVLSAREAELAEAREELGEVEGLRRRRGALQADLNDAHHELYDVRRALNLRIDAIGQLESRISEMGEVEARNATLTRDLDATREQLAAALQSLATAEVARDQAGTSLAEIETALATERTQAASVAAQLNEARRDLSEVRIALSAKTEDYQKTLAQMEELEAIISDRSAEVNDLSAELRQQRDLVRQLKNTLAETEGELEALSEESRTLNAGVKARTAFTEEQQLRIATLETALADRYRELNRARVDAEEHSRNARHHESRASQLEAELTRRGAEFDASFNRVATAEEALEAANTRIAQLSGQLEKSEASLGELSKELQGVSREKDETLRDLERASRRVTELEEAARKREVQLVEIERELVDARNVSGNLEQKIERLQTELENAREERRLSSVSVSELEEALRASDERTLQLSARLDEKEAEVASLSAELEKLQIIVDERTTGETEAQVRIAALEAEIETRLAELRLEHDALDEARALEITLQAGEIAKLREHLAAEAALHAGAVEHFREQLSGQTARVEEESGLRQASLSELEALREKLGAETARVEEESGLRQASLTEIEALREKLAAETARVEEESGLRQASLSELEALREKLGAETARVEEESGLRQASLSEIEALREKLAAETARVEEESGLRQASLSEIEALREKLAARTESIRDLQNQISAVMMQRDSRDSELSALKDKLRAMEESRQETVLGLDVAAFAKLPTPQVDPVALEAASQNLVSANKGGDEGISLDALPPVQAHHPPKASSEAVTELVPASAWAGNDEDLTVFFNESASVPSQAEIEKIDRCARSIRRLGRRVEVTVIGYAGSEGSPDFNESVSARRADAVRERLVERGVSQAVVKVRAAGQDRRFSDWKARRVEMIVAPIAVAETVN
jgi:chromosome segregation ATPase